MEITEEEKIAPQTPFYITAVFALVTIIPAFLKFKLDKRDLGRAAAANGGKPGGDG